MGLRKQVLAENTPIGVQLDEAYHKIGNIECTTVGGVTFSVLTYADAAARAAGKSPVMSKSISMEFDHSVDHGIKKMLYAYLKMLPEFDSAADV